MTSRLQAAFFQNDQVIEGITFNRFERGVEVTAL